MSTLSCAASVAEAFAFVCVAMLDAARDHAIGGPGGMSLHIALSSLMRDHLRTFKIALGPGIASTRAHISWTLQEVQQVAERLRASATDIGAIRREVPSLVLEARRPHDAA